MAVAKRIYVTRSPTGIIKVVQETNRGAKVIPNQKLLYEGAGDKIPISLLREMSYSKIIIKLN